MDSCKVDRWCFSYENNIHMWEDCSLKKIKKIATQEVTSQGQSTSVIQIKLENGIKGKKTLSLQKTDLFRWCSKLFSHVIQGLLCVMKCFCESISASCIKQWNVTPWRLLVERQTLLLPEVPVTAPTNDLGTIQNTHKDQKSATFTGETFS